MNELDALIDGLSDARAIAVLQRFAGPRARQGGVTTELTADEQSALAETTGIDAAGGAVSEGELARVALHVVASVPANVEPLRALITGPQPRTLAVGSTVAVITAAIIALQTRIKFVKDEKGKTRIEVEKAALSDNVLTDLIAKLFTFAGRGK